MRPSEYLQRYHSLGVGLDDWSFTSVALAQYVNGTDNPAWGARVPMLEGIAEELNATRDPHETRARFTAWNLPPQFTIEGMPISKMGVLRVYTGKGSPDEIADVVWLAHRFGLITNPAKPRRGSKPLTQYAAEYLGLDCNGLVGNFLGVNPDTSIDAYADHGRHRTAVSEIASGDVLISRVNNINEHIALIDEVVAPGPPTQLTIVEWGQAGQNHHLNHVTVTFRQDERRYLYYEYVSHTHHGQGKTGRKYVFAPPVPAVPRGYAIQPI